MHEKLPAAPEAKAAHGEGDVAAAFDDFMGAFEAFREANDERLAEIERKMSADALSEEKVARINAALDLQGKALERLALEGRRPRLGAPERAGLDLSGHRAAFSAYMRAGDASGLHRLEGKGLDSKAMAIGTNEGADGGYLVPDETEAEIGRRLTEVSPIRAIASTITVSSSIYRKPFSVTGPVAGWVGETELRPETASPVLDELEYPVMELYAMPAATPALLDDAILDLAAWLAGEVDIAFAEQETAAFVAGDGDRKPTGFLSVPTAPESAWAWEKLGYVASAVSGDFPAELPADLLVDTVYALKAGYRQNAHFVMNRRTEAAIRKLKDADGNYIWTPPASAGARATVMNFPVVDVEEMPDIAPGATAIAFGDFARGYLIVDRQGIRILRDPYSSKPYVLFYTTKRVGGGVHDFDAIKLVKFAAS
ncbi:phage major capsid protein [Afifella sp. IM 167]|uniref:phage major capsid protein n=1 Tax=Afifella sp. IM 167 TaxID=2033586 RepID=UPI001CCA3552|nr:phage major capsid protein [Afifella sp. IM 167]MBZ8135511.1 phage major capsid protein [Afifella sp. IM 167]